MNRQSRLRNPNPDRLMTQWTQSWLNWTCKSCLGTLAENQQRTLRLHFIEGYTLDEIANMLGQTKGNVRHHSFRGLERLRKQIFSSNLPGARAV